MMLLALIMIAGTPKVGEVAPNFDIRDTTGRRLILADMAEVGPVVLAFFPKAFTGG